MSKFVQAALALSFLWTAAGETNAQYVSMSGEYGESSGRIFNIPITQGSGALGTGMGLKIPCDPNTKARCHPGFRNRLPDLVAEPARGVGVGVDGAGVIIMPGGLHPGDSFTIPPLAFRQDASHRATAIPNNIAIVQLDTTLTVAMPRVERAKNPPAATRQFRANGWSLPGNGQTGRIAANTVPISALSQAAHDITMTYTAGPNAFGGTMANLLNGSSKIYLTGPLLMSSLGSPATVPWVGTGPALGDGILGTGNGAGWGYTVMNVLPGGVIKNLQVIAPPCTQDAPVRPVGCNMVSNFNGNGFTIYTLPGATSTKFMYAWTTGTVSVLLTRTSGFPSSDLLTGMGYDTTSMTAAGTVRNIGLVAGSYTRRTRSGHVSNGHQIIGIDMTFTPERARRWR